VCLDSDSGHALGRRPAARGADGQPLPPHHLEGTDLYGPADAVELPLPDALHPGPEAHRVMGERFAAHAFGEGGPFAGAGPRSR